LATLFYFPGLFTDLLALLYCFKGLEVAVILIDLFDVVRGRESACINSAVLFCWRSKVWGDHLWLGLKSCAFSFIG